VAQRGWQGHELIAVRGNLHRRRSSWHAVSSDRFNPEAGWSPITKISYTERSRQFVLGKLKVVGVRCASGYSLPCGISIRRRTIAEGHGRQHSGVVSRQRDARVILQEGMGKVVSAIPQRAANPDNPDPPRPQDRDMYGSGDQRERRSEPRDMRFSNRPDILDCPRRNRNSSPAAHQNWVRASRRRGVGRQTARASTSTSPRRFIQARPMWRRWMPGTRIRSHRPAIEV